MSLFKMRTLSLVRPGKGSWVDGDWVPAEDAPAVSVLATWQPATGRDLQVLPEGLRTGVFYKGYTETEIFSADQATGRSADQFVVDDEVYNVVSVAAWQNGLIPHYKFLATRVKESAAV